MEIYKYSPISLNSLKTIINSEIWFGTALQFNDPLDCIISLEILDYPTEDNLRWFYRDYQKVISVSDDDIERKILAYKSDRTVFDQDYKLYWDHCIQRMVGITCFSYSNSETLMWSHYADSHRGFCLIFDKEELRFHHDEFKLLDVKYPAVIPRVQVSANPQKHESIQFDYDSVLTTKYKRWAYEEEIRAIVPFEGAEVGRCIQYNTDALKGIIFGAKTSMSDKKTIMKIVHDKGLNIDYYQSHMQIESGDVQIKQLHKFDSFG